MTSPNAVSYDNVNGEYVKVGSIMRQELCEKIYLLCFEDQSKTIETNSFMSDVFCVNSMHVRTHNSFPNDLMDP